MVFHSDKLQSLENYEMVDVCVLDIVSFVLKTKAAEIGLFGMVPPSFLSHFTIKKQVPITVKVPMDKDGINLHFLPEENHIVTSFKKDNKMIIYDSLPHSTEHSHTKRKELFAQLSKLYINFD